MRNDERRKTPSFDSSFIIHHFLQPLTTHHSPLTTHHLTPDVRRRGVCGCCRRRLDCRRYRYRRCWQRLARRRPPGRCRFPFAFEPLVLSPTAHPPWSNLTAHFPAPFARPL